MRRCDFSSVMSIIREYVNEGTKIPQPEFICCLFDGFSKKNDDFDFDNGQINRWLKGAAPVSPRISEFYSRPASLKALAADIETAVLPILYDEDMTVENIFNLVLNDISISEERRYEITTDYKNSNADFLAKVLIFSMSRRFEKQDLKLTMGMLSPVANEMIFDGDLPKPCKYFCGRDNDIQKLHDILSEHDKVFISGIAGIGKSEFAKAYGYEHRKDYTNILYLNYNDSLVKTIAEMDFADDKSDDDEQAKFKKHNRFLRSLKSDTLIIVDNFNTTAAKEPTLSVILKYNCKIIFTT